MKTGQLYSMKLEHSENIIEQPSCLISCYCFRGNSSVSKIELCQNLSALIYFISNQIFLQYNKNHYAYYRH